jgi:hypothetical protein
MYQRKTNEFEHTHFHLDGRSFSQPRLQIESPLKRQEKKVTDSSEIQWLNSKNNQEMKYQK